MEVGGDVWDWAGVGVTGPDSVWGGMCGGRVSCLELGEVCWTRLGSGEY